MTLTTSRHLTYVHASPKNSSSLASSSNKTDIRSVEKESHLFSATDLGLKKKEWVFKHLNDVRESCTEAACGEIYRYLIGDAQPKTRTLPDGDVASQFVAFYSCTDFFLNKLDPLEKQLFQINFRLGLSGFAHLIVSSIFLEENDLHDGNFGLDKKTGKFIKIDHGQSCNENRTHRPLFEKGAEFGKRVRDNMVRFAPVKFWSKDAAHSFFQKYNEAEGAGLDRKTDRRDSHGGFVSRQYRITRELISNLFSNYFSDRYNIHLTKKLGYTPSASPLFDQRFVEFGLLEETDRDLLEHYKYHAIAKIIFTPNEFYTHIVRNAAEFPNDGSLLDEISYRVLKRKQELSNAVQNDEKFKEFLESDENVKNVKKEIYDSMIRLQLNESGSLSKRYGCYGIPGNVCSDGILEVSKVTHF